PSWAWSAAPRRPPTRSGCSAITRTTTSPARVPGSRDPAQVTYGCPSGPSAIADGPPIRCGCRVHVARYAWPRHSRRMPTAPPGQLVAEHRIGLAAGPDQPAVEREGLDRAGGDGAEGPAVRRKQPGPAEQLAHADGVDLRPPLPGHVQVQRHVAGPDQPEAAGAAAVFEEPVPGREGDVRGGLREHGQLFAGHAVQEGVR